MKKKEIKKEKEIKEAKKLKIGKLEISLSVIDYVVFAILILVYVLSPKVYSVTIALYNQGTEEDFKNVQIALGTENTEERFRLYFQYYNVLHEIGHGLIYYNKGAKVPVVDEEQLANDFAVAYWKYYGEEDKVAEIEDIANYAVEHIGTHFVDGDDYMKLGRDNSTKRSFNNSFFNFNDYGWFQFSSVKHSFEEDKSLEDVLKKMGVKDFKLTEKKTLVYEKINEETSDKIVSDAVENIRSWGLKYPDATHHFNKDPNMNFSRSMVKYLGLFEVPDFIYLFTNF